MSDLAARAARVEAARAGGLLGHKVLWERQLASTNATLREHAAQGAPAGLVVAAEVQTAGRGRGDHSWASPEGGLWFSVLLRPDAAGADPTRLMPAAAEAVVEVLGQRLSVEARVKFPNDVLIGERKLCGILAEAETVAGEPAPRHVVLGVGINVTNEVPAELASVATRIADHAAAPERWELLAWVLDALERRVT